MQEFVDTNPMRTRMVALERRVSAMEETLAQVRLLAELWKRSNEHYPRIMGADLAQILDGAKVEL